MSWKSQSLSLSVEGATRTWHWRTCDREIFHPLGPMFRKRVWILTKAIFRTIIWIYMNSKTTNSHQKLIQILSETHTRPSVQFSSVTQSCPTLCDPVNRSTPGLPVHHQLPEFTQTHVHWVHDAIQPSHPLSSPFPPAPNPSQHQSLFQWVNSSHEVAKVLEFQL